MPNHKIIISKDILEGLYLKRRLSPFRIGQKFNCSAVTIRARLKEENIVLRSKSEAQIRYKKHDFSGNEVERSYLIGFRLGDLNVYQKSKLGIVVARCNTTQPVQIKLMKELFSKYGQVM